MKKFKFTINGNVYEVEIQGFEENIAKVEVNGTPYDVEIHRDLKMTKTPTLVRAEAPPPKGKETRIPKVPSKTTNLAVKSPLPGTIISVLVKEGDKVSMGQKLLTMEAMKMENNVLAEKAGIVKSVLVKPGDTVLQNDILVEID
ncbi:MAG: biotin/lipoyl-binding protein [Bacteroidales bacterium]|nr:biotin/lipoyl-binding protein [Bacteroidales bacterium]HNW72710.1 biotin/lipoyl-binding protein [Bacteroidales bacterium]HPS49246.1 biotin/lipoyl-binding protein [Bacteroidales bacterium]